RSGPRRGARCGHFARTALRQGLLSPTPRFPEQPADPPGAWDRFGRWVGDVFTGRRTAEPPVPAPLPDADAPDRGRRWSADGLPGDPFGEASGAVAEAVDDVLSDPQTQEALDEAARQLEREAERLSREAETAVRALEREAARALREALE
ncbi:MAG: hypothetical protein AAFQ43_15145, partial [Bacteroidota bacterium]